MSDKVRATKGERIKEEIAEGKVRLVTARTDTGRCEEKRKLCPPECDNAPCWKQYAAWVFVTLSSFISPSSCTISSLLLSCRDDILCSNSSFLCLQHTPTLHYCQIKECQEAAIKEPKDSQKAEYTIKILKSLSYNGTRIQTGNRIQLTVLIYTSHVLHLQIWFRRHSFALSHINSIVWFSCARRKCKVALGEF